MLRNRWVVLPTLCLGLGLAVAAAAGGSKVGKDGKYEKCEMETQACLDTITASLAKRGYVGIEYDDKKSEGPGIKVTKVLADTPAAAAGLREGDVLVALNGIAMTEENHETIGKAWSALGPGSVIRYSVLRDGKTSDVPVTLTAMPKEVVQRVVGAHMIEHSKSTVVRAAR